MSGMFVHITVRDDIWLTWVAATLVQFMLRDVWSMGDLPLIDEIVSPEHLHHEPVETGPVWSCERLKALIATYTATGTHEGPLFGAAPTDRST